jgi:tetratricopeptide (TPR) repeat protein/DNA-binding XRE family transcriptional regulator
MVGGGESSADLIAVVLRGARAGAAMTQEELAHHAGVSVRSIRDLEAGRVDSPRQTTIRLLSRVLGEHGQELRSVGRARVATRATPSVVGAAQLPRNVPSFVGRVEESSALDEHLVRSERRVGSGTAVSAITGTAGVGKTALAVRWARHACGEFPDGQLYVDLRGFDVEEPLAPAEVLAGFLLGLGVDARTIPPRADIRAAMYRSLTAGRRMLLLLDNAANSEQVRPLLPGDPSVRVLITSRDSLAGLVAREEVHRIDLGSLSLGESVELLRVLVGRRAIDDPGATRELAEACVRLPLALRVAAELTNSLRYLPIRQVSADLVSHSTRLTRLDAGGDVRTAVDAVFSWSYRNLGPHDARVFRLLGLHPGTSFDVATVAALGGIEPRSAESALVVLARAHLIQPEPDGRYGMHDLMRAYARRQTESIDDDVARARAVERWLDYLVCTTVAAVQRWVDARGSRLRTVFASAGLRPEFDSQDQAVAWLETHRQILVSACDVVFAAGHDDHVIGLAEAASWFLLRTCHYEDCMTMQSHAVDAARRRGDDIGLALALRNLGSAHMWRGDLGEARRCHEEAYTVVVETGDHLWIAHTHESLGFLCHLRGDYAAAARHDHKAAGLHSLDQNVVAEAYANGNLAATLLRLGRVDEAAEKCERALRLFTSEGNHQGRANILETLGEVRARQGRHREAILLYEKSRALSAVDDDPVRVATTLNLMGESHREANHLEVAKACHQQALSLFRRAGNKLGLAATLNSYGVVLEKAREHHRAIERFTQALALAAETGDLHERSRAHAGLDKSYTAIENYPAAASHRRAAAAS